MSRLVVVSNRVGLPDQDGSARAGGLEVALKAALTKHKGVWFGWSGKIAKRAAIKTETIIHENITYVVTDLAEDDFQEFYNGFANRVLWPILHYRLELAEFSRRDLGGYIRVNEHFAQELRHILRPDDVIWAHDYHLIPFAKALRDRGHLNRIGFFLHVPFPPPEIVTALPGHERLFSAMAQYDLIGLQTDVDSANVARYFAAELKLPRRSEKSFVTGRRSVEVGTFPVGVDMATFARLGQRSVRSPFVQKVLASLAGRPMIIGVDRLDYSKGITHRMDAFERFLAAMPEWRGKVTFLQIAPKSRTEIPEYAEMEREVSEAAGRINGAYGEVDWTPIRYVNRAYSRPVLAGLYRSARAGLVTPLRDGMNLVAKEFVASQNQDDPGVLILSRFAGAAYECDAALLVNPYDPDAVGGAIARALEMPLGERRARQAAMMKVLEANNVEIWAERFLAALTRINAPARFLDEIVN